MPNYFDEFISPRTQFFAVLGSVMLFSIIIILIRNSRLKEGYSILWFFLALIALIFSVFSELLFTFSRSVGVFYPPAALFIILLANLLLIAIHFSVIISKQETQIKKLVQELGLLKNKFEVELKRKKR